MQGQSIPPEEGTKAIKGQGNSPNRERTKERQEKVFVKGRSKIGLKAGSRSGTPRAPALAKKVIKGSAGAINSASEDEDTPKHKQVRGEVDLNEDDPPAQWKPKKEDPR